eukprot:7583916-Alexandrium_andersonii.AAC.1
MPKRPAYSGSTCPISGGSPARPCANQLRSQRATRSRRSIAYPPTAQIDARRPSAAIGQPRKPLRP